MHPAEPQITDPRLKRIFYAMPFTGKSYDLIAKERRAIKKALQRLGLELSEQFLGVEDKEKFEAHAYGPLHIAKKDHDLMKQSGVIIADYSGDSIGRDCEIVIAKEVLDRRVIAIVPDKHMQNHPWIRLYSDYIVGTQAEAFKLAQKLSGLSLSAEVSKLSRAQKDKLDEQLAEMLKRSDPVQVSSSLFPTELQRRWKALFGAEYQNVIRTSYKPLPTILRRNPLKLSHQGLMEIARKYSWKLTRLQFSDKAYRLELPLGEAITLWKLPEYLEGKFYVQQLASQLPAVVLDPKAGDRVLDIAAAPGSKTTQMAELMEDKGEVLANDNSSERLEVLKAVVNRQGLTNVNVHLGDGATLGDQYTEQFDKVMVDAPCSSEGILRYKAHKFLEWYLLGIYRETEMQRRLLESGYKALKPGGTLVYSTCTYGPEENEAIVDWLLKQHPDARIEPVALKGVKTHPGLTEWEHTNFDQSLRKARRLLPTENNSTGFYLAKLTKQAR
jgi:NOL1/NOP2/sun family putative RNA methylase